MESTNENKPTPVASHISRRIVKSDGVLFILVFSILTAIFCHPIILNPQGHLFQRPIGDKGTNLWNLWWVYHAIFDRHTSPLYCDIIFTPWGCDLRYHTLSVVNGVLASPITAYSGPNVAYNTLFVFWTFLTGVFAALWARQFTLNKSFSILVGIIAAFNPYRCAHQIHLNLFSTAWIFLAFYFCERMIQTMQKRYITGFTLAWLLALFTDWYYGLYVGLYWSIRMLFVYFPFKQNAFSIIKMIKTILIPLLFVVFALFCYFYKPNALSFQKVFIDPINPKFAAFWSLDILHLLFPPWAIDWLNLPLASLFNSSEFYFHPGISFIILFVGFSGFAFKNNKCTVWILFILAILFLVFSLGPVLEFNQWILQIGTFPVLAPASLFEFVPFLTVIRVFARFAYLGFIFLVMIGLLGFQSFLLHRFPKLHSTVTLIPLAALFFIETQWEWPRMKDYSVKIETFSGPHTSILELPFTPSKLSGLHLYHQTLHQKPIFVVEFSRLTRYKQRYLKAFPIFSFLNRMTSGENLTEPDKSKLQTQFCQEIINLRSTRVIVQGILQTKENLQITRNNLEKMKTICKEINKPILLLSPKNKEIETDQFK